MGKDILVIGGSGMLKKACLEYTQEGNRVFVIARKKSKKLALLKREFMRFSAYLFAMESDYNDSPTFRETLVSIPFSLHLVISWIHSSSVLSHLQIIQTLRPQHYFQLLGSSDLGYLKRTLKESFCYPTTQTYQIVLGHIKEKTEQRWLTHDEISCGITNAVKKRSSLSIIGSIDPIPKP